MTIIYAVILFVLLIFPHELGHFAAAKAVGVQVNEFAFGMGPALLQKQGRETLYSVRLIPIGGYCAMEGEDEESDNRRAFNNKPLWAKLLVLAAGSAMNVLLAALVLSVMMGVAGAPTTVLDQVQEGTPAYEAGLLPGDRIVAADGQRIEAWTDLTSRISSSGQEIQITAERNGIEKTFLLKPEKEKDGRFVIGITSKLSHNVFTAAENGLKGTWNLTKAMFYSIGQLFTGQVSVDEISGPVGIVSMVGDTSQYGLFYFGYLVALISLNLALINMLPLPALDGGRIIFALIRSVTGRLISDDLEGKIHGAGMILLFAFMIFITWNDITRLFT